MKTKRPIIISSVEMIPATPEQERQILDLLAQAHEATKRQQNREASCSFNSSDFV
jgi:hypothetical protein